MCVAITRTDTARITEGIVTEVKQIIGGKEYAILTEPLPRVVVGDGGP